MPGTIVPNHRAMQELNRVSLTPEPTISDFEFVAGALEFIFLFGNSLRMGRSGPNRKTENDANQKTKCTHRIQADLNPDCGAPSRIDELYQGMLGVNSMSREQLIEWYRTNKRELPWRENRDPYRIWISETMLQQTTTTAVIPYFQRFLTRFPTLKDLAQAPTEAVLEAWAGLGYYSRARNLHRAAQALFQMPEFPKSYKQLIELPGFGPYTSRSVASLAFDEPVGVVDGNVIRVLARVEGKEWDWWQNSARQEIQARADAWVQGFASHEMNQAVMELGRTICTPQSPSCLLCPLRKDCLSLKQAKVHLRPKPKPRREREIWTWNPELTIEAGKILLRKNTAVPFLRGQWLPPGTAEQIQLKPKKFDYRHSITHHDIFVTVEPPTRKIIKEDIWVSLEEIGRYVQASLVQKAIAHFMDRAERNPLLARHRQPKASRPSRHV